MVYFNLIINKMGCATVKEKLESKIMLLKLQKVDILQEREEKLKEYQKITGETLHRKPVPDYVIKDESEVNNINIKKKKKKPIQNKKRRKRSGNDSDEDSDNDDDDDEEESDSEQVDSSNISSSNDNENRLVVALHQALVCLRLRSIPLQ